MIRLERRQLIFVAAGLVLIFAIIQWLISPILGYREKLASNIERSDQRLQILIRLEQTYRQVIAENARIELDLGGRGQDFTLFAFLEALASRDGLKKKIEYMRPSVKSLSDTHQEEQVEMRLNGVTLALLVPYIYHIETAPEKVRVKRLTIRPQQKNRSLLEVNMLVVTHASREAPRSAGSKAARNSRQLGT